MCSSFNQNPWPKVKTGGAFKGIVKWQSGWMRSSRVVRAFDSQCCSRNCPGFDPSILRHSGIWGAADEAVLSIVHKKIQKTPLKKVIWQRGWGEWYQSNRYHFAYNRRWFLDTLKGLISRCKSQKTSFRLRYQKVSAFGLRARKFFYVLNLRLDSDLTCWNMSLALQDTFFCWRGSVE